MFARSSTTISTSIQATYHLRVEEIRELVANAVTPIYTRSGFWSSTNDKSLLGVIAHFTDATYTNRTRLLAAPRLWGAHTGENLAACFLAVCDKFGIREKLVCFIMDNASNNDTMLAALERRVPSVNSGSRLLCAGHVLDLIDKAILYGNVISAFHREILGCGDARAFEPWRKFGAIGKVHNTVKHIMRSDQPRQEFMGYQGPESGGDDALFEHTERLLVKD